MAAPAETSRVSRDGDGWVDKPEAALGRNWLVGACWTQVGSSGLQIAPARLRWWLGRRTRGLGWGRRRTPRV